MKIGNIEEFKAGQLGKVEKRKQEDKRIKQGIYQMHAMVESECMETLIKERENAQSQNEDTRTEKEGTNTEQGDEKKTDIQMEIEKLLFMGSKHYNTISGKE